MSKKKPKTHRVTRCQCPQCKAPMDSATSASGGSHKPRKDDVSICLKCAAVLLYNADLTLRIPDPMEMLALELGETWPEVERTRRAIIRLAIGGAE